MAQVYMESDSALSDSEKDIARMIASMVEEAEAIQGYQQRIATAKDPEVKKIIEHAQKEEMEHFATELEWLTRKMPAWREKLKEILFKDGDIIENAKKHE
jgi:hypothetical protein